MNRSSLMECVDRCLLRVSRWVFRGNLTWTRRARIVLALAPIAVPVSIVRALVYAAWVGVTAFVDSLGWQAQEGWYFWYRSVYRVARYGSVHDE